MGDGSARVGDVAEVDDVATGQGELAAVGRERHASTPPGLPAIGGPARRRSWRRGAGRSRWPRIVEVPATGRDRAAVGRERQAQDLDALLVGPPELAAALGVEQDQDGPGSLPVNPWAAAIVRPSGE